MPNSYSVPDFPVNVIVPSLDEDRVVMPFMGKKIVLLQITDCDSLL